MKWLIKLIKIYSIKRNLKRLDKLYNSCIYIVCASCNICELTEYYRNELKLLESEGVSNGTDKRKKHMGL